MPRLLSLAALLLVASGATAAPPDFDKQIAPLLASHCTDCHGGAKPKGKLDLTRKAGAAETVVPGKPADSELWKRVAAGEMPPKKPLSDADQKLLKEWIAGGAKWGTDPIDPFRITTRDARRLRLVVAATGHAPARSRSSKSESRTPK